MHRRPLRFRVISPCLIVLGSGLTLAGSVGMVWDMKCILPTNPWLSAMVFASASACGLVSIAAGLCTGAFFALERDMRRSFEELERAANDKLSARRFQKPAAPCSTSRASA